MQPSCLPDIHGHQGQLEQLTPSLNSLKAHAIMGVSKMESKFMNNYYKTLKFSLSAS